MRDVLPPRREVRRRERRRRSRSSRLYGLSLGIAFQIQDDILDIVGDAGTVGKTLGIDVEKGKMTLPMIHFLRTAPAEHRDAAALAAAEQRRRQGRADPQPDPAERLDRVRPRTAPGELRRRGPRGARGPARHAKPAGVLDTMAEFVVSRPM